MCLLKFDALPGTDVVSYLSEKSMYSEQLVADMTLQILDALDYIQWRGRVYLVGFIYNINPFIQGGRKKWTPTLTHLLLKNHFPSNFCTPISQLLNF